jgi:hypothetical protein
MKFVVSQKQQQETINFCFGSDVKGAMMLLPIPSYIQLLHDGFAANPFRQGWLGKFSCQDVNDILRVEHQVSV